MKKLIIILLLSIVLLSSVVSAVIPITEDNKTSTYIKWSWAAGTTLVNLSVDGYRVVLADYNDNKFILSDLNPNEVHTLKIYTASDSGTYTSTTLPDVGDATLAIIFGYIFFIAAIIAIIIGRWIPVVAWIGCGLSIIGIVNMISVSFWASFVFMCIFCAGVLVALSTGSE